jgi:hypothetical protein
MRNERGGLGYFDERVGEVSRKLSREFDKLMLSATEFIDSRIEDPSKKLDYWSDDHLNEYITRSAFEKDFNVPLSVFPRVIFLSNTWYDILDQLRDQSRDGFERHFFVAAIRDTERHDDLEPDFYTEQSSKRKLVVMPKSFAIGEKNCISGELKSNFREWARSKGVDHFVGNVHSHPKLNTYNSLLKDIKFSTTDMYNLVGDYHVRFSVVVKGDQNIFVFRSKESERYDGLDYLGESSKDLDGFKSYWKRKSGWDSLKKNVKIAKAHKLALYTGISNISLLREHPGYFKDFFKP